MRTWFWRAAWSVIVLAVTTGVALWIYKKQTHKALTYRVVSISPLVPLQARGFGDLRLHKGDKPIERPFLTTIRLANSGDLPIQPSDFAVPLTIRVLGSGAAAVDKMIFYSPAFNIPYKTGVTPLPPLILDARVAVTNPPQIPVALEYSGPTLTIKPLLLNVGDDISVEILINGDVQGIQVAGRISGVKEIYQDRSESAIPDDKRIGQVASKASFTALIIALLAALVGSIRVTYGSSVAKHIPYWFTTVVVCLFSLLAVGFAFLAFSHLERDVPAYLLLVAITGAGPTCVMYWLLIMARRTR